MAAASSVIFDKNAFDKNEVLDKYSWFPSLLIDCLFTPNGRKKNLKVISSSLFIFPDRAKSEKESYIERVHSYIRGLDTCLSSLDTTAPGWIYRLYVDYSVYKTYSSENEPEAYEASVFVKSKLEALIEEYGVKKRWFEIYACRSKEKSISFLPSIWRFLPMGDKKVDVMFPIDLDNPVSELAMHFTNTWLSDPSACNMMFLTLDYMSPQCTLYIANHMDTAQDGICPVAQFWVWRRKGPVDYRDTLKRLFDMVEDPNIQLFFEHLNFTWVQDKIRKEIVDSNEFSVLSTSKLTSREALDIVTKAVIRALTKSRSRTNTWTKIVLNDPRLIEFVAMMSVGHVLANSYDNDRISKMLRNLSSTEISAMSDIVLKHGYGVDEWLLHAIMRNPGDGGCASLMFASSPDIGVVVTRSYMSMHTSDGAPQVVSWIHDVVDIQCDDYTGKYSRNLLAEYAVRACAMLRMLRPDRGSDASVYKRWESVRDDYLERLERCISKKENKDIYRREVVKQLLNNEGFIMKGCIRRFLILTAHLLSDWLRPLGGSFDAQESRVTFGTMESFEAYKEVMIKAFFLEMKMLHWNMCLPPSYRKGRPLPW